MPQPLPQPINRRHPIGPSPHAAEELRKLNTEMLQLDNQRFLLTTTAVILFGTVTGWVTTTLLRREAPSLGEIPQIENPDPNIDPATYLPVASTALLCTVLLVLFYYQASLALTIRWLAAYHMLQGSRWEWTWYAFRQQKHRYWWGALPFLAGFRLTVWIFAALIVATFGYFLLLHITVFPEDWGRVLSEGIFPPVPEQLWVLVGVLLVLALILVWFKNLSVLHLGEISYMEHWTEAERMAAKTRVEWGGEPIDP
jgi:hypothetical protein